MNAKIGAAAGVAGVLFATAILLLLLALVIAGAGAGAPSSALCGPGGTGQVVGGVRLDAEQMGNAQAVVSAVARRGRRLARKQRVRSGRDRAGRGRGGP